jgi:hypothetical protein
MNPTTLALLEQQDALLEAMSTIRVMRRGTLSTQEYAQRRARKAGGGASGPYHLLQGYRDGAHFSRRVSAEGAPHVARQIESRKRLQALCAQYVLLGEALAEQPGAEAEWEERLKKKRGRRSSKAGRSRSS